MPSVERTEPLRLAAYVEPPSSGDSGLRVAVCDEKGQPIKGFEQSQEIRTDKTAVDVSWGESKLEKLRGQTVRLRFTLQKGKLYSYWVGEPK